MTLREVETRDPLFVALPDGTRLAATLWLPQDAAASPVPVVLEAVPYRRRDGTVFRDLEAAPWLAARGIAYCRLDLRGAGDSAGLLADEYAEQEQRDLCDVIAWLAAQPWCSGAVGMTGISWGGFNALQVAARRPPALKAIIALCCSDDRYADDVHYMGGSLLTEDPAWSCFMLALNALPPDPQSVGTAWRDIWQQRLAGNRCWSETWIAHQRRDAYWRRGSVCEDYGAIAVPTYLVGGWDDSYSNAVPRLLAGLSCPRKGLIGPWSHSYPFRGAPGPNIGYLQEALRWWRHWLLGEATGIMAEPLLRAWIGEPQVPRPSYSERPGRWVAEREWPPRDAAPLTLHLNDRRLEERPQAGPSLAIRSPATAGRDCGRWGGYGGDCPDMPLDQRREDALGLAFDSAPLQQDLEILGAPLLEFEGSADRPQAALTLRLCDVAPDGSSSLVTWGTLNLTHGADHAAATPLAPGTLLRARVRLNDIGRRFPAGHRVRLVLATQHWPILWPQPGAATLALASGACRLLLPRREARAEDSHLPPFEAPDRAPPLAVDEQRPARNSRQVVEDVGSGRQTIELYSDYGRWQLLDRGLVIDSWCRDRFEIHPDDPQSARAESEWFLSGESLGVATGSRATVTLSADATQFRLTWRCEALENGQAVHVATGERLIDRDGA